MRIEEKEDESEMLKQEGRGGVGNGLMHAGK